MRIISSMRILALVSLLIVKAQHVLSQDEQPMPPKNETLAVTGTSSGGAADNECGLEVKVGCILAHTADDENPLDCNAYVPETPQNCTMQVRYTYRVDKDDKLSGMKLVSALRYREGSYWESQFGNPRPFSGSRWDTLLTVKGGYYRMDQWEGEYVNFCQPQSVSTLFEFNVDGIDTKDDVKSFMISTKGSLEKKAAVGPKRKLLAWVKNMQLLASLRVARHRRPLGSATTQRYNAPTARRPPDRRPTEKNRQQFPNPQRTQGPWRTHTRFAHSETEDFCDEKALPGSVL
jgi:hypothetical protein